MGFAEADNGRRRVARRNNRTTDSVISAVRSLANRASVSVVIIGEVGSRRRDMTTNGRHRLGTAVIVVRLMGCAFLRLLSQPADYDMLVASARASGIYSIPRVPGTVTPFARLMTRWHLALPRPSVPLLAYSRTRRDGSIREESVAGLGLRSRSLARLITANVDRDVR